MDEIIIRRMKTEDVEAVAAIEKATFARPWSAESFRREGDWEAAAGVYSRMILDHQGGPGDLGP